MDAQVLAFDEADPDDLASLGGKGASLARMRALGLPVPPGFIVSTQVCHRFHAEGDQVPEDVWREVVERVHALEAELGQAFGGPGRPLLLSVRSGAPVSMPGMMDTVLDIGLCASTLPALAEAAGAEFAWDTRVRLVRMFGNTVAGIASSTFADLGEVSDAEADPAALASAHLAAFEAAAGVPFPEDPWDQLQQAVAAVFRSWESPRAVRYRDYAGISHTLGTAVVVQAMVFGNLEDQSGTGVAFTRDPATGSPQVYGDFLVRAQGEDVVAGEHDPTDIDAMAAIVPAAHAALLAAVPVLERSYTDMCDIEFTVEQGRFWLLQVRRGQRTAAAAVRIALDLVEEGLLDLDGALERVSPVSLVRARDPLLDPAAPRQLLGSGLAASPGAGCGQVALSAARAEELVDAGQQVVLVRPHTSPDDIAGFIAAQGIVTAHGGRTSHAAVVARGMNLPAVCGVPGLEVGSDSATFPGGEVREGDEVTVDGTSGAVYAGRLPFVEPPEDPRMQQLLARCDERRRTRVVSPTGTEPWADGELPTDGTARCASESEVEAALDDDAVARLLLDPGASDDPAVLLRSAAEATDFGFELYLQVDDHWPPSLRALPDLAWAGIHAGPRGDWAARLLASRQGGAA